MDKGASERLKVQCDKNTVWKKAEEVTQLWVECIDTNMIQPEQVKTFRKWLMGMLMVQHDEGKPIKLFKELYNGDRQIEYTLLRRAMDFSGIPERCMSGKIKRITLYPNGSFKVEYAGQKRAVWK